MQMSRTEMKGDAHVLTYLFQKIVVRQDQNKKQRKVSPQNSAPIQPAENSVSFVANSVSFAAISATKLGEFALAQE